MGYNGVNSVWRYISLCIQCLNEGVDILDTAFTTFGLSLAVFFGATVLFCFFRRYVFRGFL